MVEKGMDGQEADKENGRTRGGGTKLSKNENVWIGRNDWDKRTEHNKTLRRRGDEEKEIGEGNKGTKRETNERS